MWDLWWTKCHCGRFSPSNSVSLQILIPPIAPQSSSIIRGCYKRPISGRRTKWPVSPHLKKLKKKKTYEYAVLGSKYRLNSGHTYLYLHQVDTETNAVRKLATNTPLKCGHQPSDGSLSPRRNVRMANIIQLRKAVKFMNLRDTDAA
jgi:hypothetical protein